MSQNRQLFSKQASGTVSETFNFGATNGMMGGLFSSLFLTVMSHLGPRRGGVLEVLGPGGPGARGLALSSTLASDTS